MAYAYLALVYDGLGENNKSVEYLSKAFQLRDRVTESEKFLISSTYYLIVTGELEKAIRVCELWNQTYPRDERPLLNLGDIYGSLGDYEKSAAESRKCLHLSPDDSLCNSNLMEAYTLLNRLDDARSTYQKSIKLRPDFEDVHTYLYELAFLQGDSAEMERQLHWSVGKPGVEDILLSYHSDTEAFSGRLKNARDFSRRAAESARRNDKAEVGAAWQMNSALREAEFGNLSRAIAETSPSVTTTSNRDVQTLDALTLARSGASTRAEALMEALQKKFPSDTIINGYWVPTIRATIEINRSNPSKAIELLEVATPFEQGLVLSNLKFGAFLYPPFVRGQAYLQMRDGAKAASEFQKILDRRSMVVNNPLFPLAYVGIARAYVLQGDKAKARAAYQDFFALWKDADPDVPILIAAKSEYAKLK
jgi:tetratricopeptide (TPR) repeat protein